MKKILKMLGSEFIEYLQYLGMIVFGLFGIVLLLFLCLGGLFSIGFGVPCYIAIPVQLLFWFILKVYFDHQPPLNSDGFFG